MTAVSREQVREYLEFIEAQFAALEVNPTFFLPIGDITAISQTSGPALQGTVTFSTSGVNPNQGLLELPQNVVDPNSLIADNACTRGVGSELSITGRGGLPSSPYDALSSNYSQLNWVEAGQAEGRGQEAGGRGSRGRREAGGVKKKQYIHFLPPLPQEPQEPPHHPITPSPHLPLISPKSDTR